MLLEIQPLNMVKFVWAVLSYLHIQLIFSKVILVVEMFVVFWKGKETLVSRAEVFTLELLETLETLATHKTRYHDSLYKVSTP